MTTDGLIRVGVVGCGYWGPKLARNFTRQRGAEVTVVCDSLEERAMAIAEEYRVERHATGFQSVTQAEDVDLVVVATPSRTHHAIAKDAIAAGKHVLITKPITTCVEHAEELVALAERQGVVVAVDHTFLYTGAVSRIRELVASGELGEIYYVDSVRINLGLFQADVNVVWDLAPHDLSIIDYILGGVLPAEVSAVGASHAGSRTENIAYVTMRYGPHLLSHVHVNWLAPAKVRRTIVGGSKRMLVYDDMEPSEKIKIYDAGVSITPSLSEDELHSQVVLYRAGDMLAPKVDTREALAVEAEHIIDCIRTGMAPRADGHAGLRVVRILEAAQASIDAGGVPLAIERERASAAQGT